jgi:UPF0755 protein
MILLFLVVVAAAGTAFFYRALTTPYKGYADETIRFEVKKGAGTASIMKRLQRSGILRDDFFPTIYLKTLRRGASLKAGVYEFKGELSPIAVLDKIISGEVILRSVTLREGLDRFAVAALMSDAGFGTVDDWVKLTADPEMIRDVDPDAESLEGYLFPDTYLLTPGTPPRAVVKQMLDNFRKQFGDELAYITNGLSVHETITLASVVETEAQKQEERPIVASVYLNRHRRSMPLQADPTVIYAMKLAGKWNGNIRRGDLKIDSPYNTYVRRGFPPGPIANPGLASLRAAAAPATTNYLYFVSRNDGSHVFSPTLSEHNRNVQEFQRTYWRKLRQAQQPAAT